MSTVILDFGSGNTCQNRLELVKQMLDGLKAVDTGKHEVTIKWQLFEEAGKNEPLYRSVFAFAYKRAAEMGYKTTASVFDLDSLKFLLGFDVPFIKIANRRDLDWLIGEVPRKIPVYVSFNQNFNPGYREKMKPLMCISKYPATIEDYEKAFDIKAFVHQDIGISDHTTDFTLWNRYKPQIIEWHYKLEDSTGLDAGLFARTPAQLKEVL